MHRGHTNTFARREKMTGDAPTARTVLAALPQSHVGLCGMLVGPDKDTHGTPVLLRMEAVGGPEQASRDTIKNDKTKVCSLTLWLPTK